LENAETVFQGEKSSPTDDSLEKKELYSKIGELQVQVDFLKKSWGNESK
jgi:transposase